MVKRFVPSSTKIDPEKLAAWLEEKWKGEKRCPICKSNNWSISERALELRSWQLSSMEIPTSQVVAMLQCLVCGNVIFINPFIAGLFKEEEEPNFATVATSENQR